MLLLVDVKREGWHYMTAVTGSDRKRDIFLSKLVVAYMTRIFNLKRGKKKVEGGPILVRLHELKLGAG